MRLKVDINQNAIDAILAAAESYISKIENVRELASQIIGYPISSLSGEVEVNEYLTLSEYPNANKTIAANLKGCKLEYEAYKAKLGDLQRLKRFEVSNGKVVISSDYKDLITEENTVYLEDENVPMYKAIEAAAKALNKANSLLPNPIAHKIIDISHNGTASVNIARFYASLVNPRA
jgi:hypothetical protein